MKPGSRWAHLRFGEKLGEGGMATVYAAVDERLKRDVAVKALRQGGGTWPEVQAAVLREARILSRFDHPNVCRIYDVIESQEPGDGLGALLVMERIEGRNLRQVLGETSLDFADRLRIALQIADALEAAHAQSIAHRDLKPGNIMLSEAGQVKVLDFGLARPLRDGVAEPRPLEGTESALVAAAQSAEALPSFWQSIDTGGYGQIAGTPAYMSPEQARGEPSVAATDIFSFGLILQELFSGESAYGELAESPRMLALAQGGTTRPLQGVDSDLQTLVERMKSASPLSRPTAAAVRVELQRLADKPRRRRRRLLAAAVLAMTLLAAGKYTLDLDRERARAVAAQDEAEALTDLMLGLFRAPNPNSEEAWTTPQGVWDLSEGPVTARQVLDRAAESWAGEISRLEVQVRFLLAIGGSYRGIGEPVRAAEIQEQALELARDGGLDDLVLAEAWQSLGSSLTELGRSEEAGESFQQALEIRSLLEPDSGAMATLLTSMAINLSNSGGGPEEAEEVESLLLRALEIQRNLHPADDLRVLRLQYDLAWAAMHRSDFPTALTRIESVLNQLNDRVDTSHPLRVSSLGLYARSLERLGRKKEAEPIARDYLRLSREVFGQGHEDYVEALEIVAILVRSRGASGEALAYLEEAISISAASKGPESPQVRRLRGTLVNVLRAAGRLREAESTARAVLHAHRDLFGPESWSVLVAEFNLASTLASTDQPASWDEADDLLRHVMTHASELRGPKNGLVRRAHAVLAMVQLRRGQPELAEQIVRGSFRKDPDAMLRDGEASPRHMAILATCWTRLGRAEEGERLLVKVVEEQLGDLGPAAIATREGLRYLVDFYELQGRRGSEVDRYRALLEEGERTATDLKPRAD